MAVIIEASPFMNALLTASGFAAGLATLILKLLAANSVHSPSKADAHPQLLSPRKRKEVSETVAARERAIRYELRPGQRMRYLRENKGMKRSDLAKAARITRKLVARLEDGEEFVDNLPLAQVRRIAAALGSPLAFVIGEDGASNQSDLT